jgi:hypothetical protein
MSALLKQSVKRWIYDESHFRVAIIECKTCQMHFGYMMTEMVDWQGGEDPIARQWITLSDQEVSSLDQLEPDAAVRSILEIGSDSRPCLVYDWPKEGRRSIFWSTGMRPLPHD